MPHENETGGTIPVLDLFAGIGGFSLAFEAVLGNFRTIGFAEIDPYAVARLSELWPDVPQFGAVQNITRDSVLERCGVLPTVVTGGFPCQPHSSAGKRLASADERDLWDECARVLRDLRPPFAVFENVRGLLTSESGLFLNRVLSDLADLRYACQWQVVSAEDIGAPHRRERIWLLCIDELAFAQSARGGVRSELRGEDGRSRRSLPSESDIASESELADSGGNGRGRSGRQERRELQGASGSEFDGRSGVQRLIGEEAQLADSSSGGRRVGRESSGQGGLAHGSDEDTGQLDNTEPARLQGLDGDGDGEEGRPKQDRPTSTTGLRWPSAVGLWPSRPGEQQYWWEPPRVVVNSVQPRPSPERKRGGQQTGSAEPGEGVVVNSNGRRCEQRVARERELPITEQGCGGSSAADTEGEQPAGAGQVEPKLGGVPDGLSYRTHSAVNRIPRLKALGNAIVPGVAVIFARAIYRVMSR